MIYIDASALVKLVREEAESSALRDYLADHRQERLAASAVAWVEVPRAVAGHQAHVGAAHDLLADVAQVSVDTAIVDDAAIVGPSTLRSLDAIHLVSALRLRSELVAFVAYDRRLLEAAEAAGLPTARPS